MYVLEWGFKWLRNFQRFWLVAQPECTGFLKEDTNCMGREHSTNHLQIITASMPTTTCASAYELMTKSMVSAFIACYNNGKCF
jgi:hypothetical protein